MIGMGQRPGTKIDQKLDLSLKIAAKAVASMHQAEVAVVVQKYLAAGVFVGSQEEAVCPSCGRETRGAFCRKCNQPADNGDLLDSDEGGEDREVDDHSDSEDADDFGSLDQEDGGGLPEDASAPPFGEMVARFLAELGIPGSEIPIYLYLIMKTAEHEAAIDAPLDQDLAKAAVDWSGKTEEFLQALWAEKPFNQEDFDDLLEEWLAEGGASSPDEYEEPFLEIRKVDREYISIVHDPFEDVRAARGKQNAPVQCRGKDIPAGLFLIALRKRNRNLERILEAIVKRRRDFLDSATAEDAMRILRERPLELKDIASETGIDQGIVSRHFSTKSVLTPHGTFMLGDLTSQRSRTGEEITVSAGHDRTLEVIRRGDSTGAFYSDREVVDILKKEHGIEVSREQVQKIRKKYDIPNSRKRRAISVE